MEAARGAPSRWYRPRPPSRLQGRRHAVALSALTVFVALQLRTLGFVSPKLLDEDAHLKWRPSPRLTDFAAELLEARRDSKNSVEKLGCDVERTQLQGYIDKDGQQSPNLLTRKESRYVYEEAKRLIDEGTYDHVVVTGNAGIGKSRNLVYMMQLLLEDGKPFVYSDRRVEEAYAFLPDQSGTNYKAWECSTIGFASFVSRLHREEEVYILINPAHRGGEQVMSYAHNILAASPNLRHYRGWYKDGACTLYLGPWGQDELLQVKSEFPIDGKELSEAEVLKRFAVFGGSLRHLFCSAEDSEARKRQMQAAGGRLEVLKVLSVLTAGPDQLEAPTVGENVAGTLFTVRGESGNLRRRAVSFVSHFAQQCVVDAVRDDFYARVRFANSGEKGSYGPLHEGVVLSDLSKDGVFNTAPLYGEEVQEQLKLAAVAQKLCNKKDEFVNAAAALKDRDVLLVPPVAYEVLDALDRRDRWYQSTVSKKHGVAVFALVELLESLGVVRIERSFKENTAGKESIREVVTVQESFTVRIYYCVPEDIFLAFKKPGFRGPHNENQHVKDAIGRHVQFWKLCIPKTLAKPGR